ncbi:MAG: hypothetical protein NG740_07075, partial [Omnitrophica bacterium]|nr:hypothetical protein [Candidatus Omnitrophota bacterium]
MICPPSVVKGTSPFAATTSSIKSYNMAFSNLWYIKIGKRLSATCWQQKGCGKGGRPLLLAVFVIMMVVPVRAMAETIELKDGKTIVGDIIKETEDAVIVSKDGGIFVYSLSRDRIKNIKSSSGE